MSTSARSLICKGWVVPEHVQHWTPSAIYFANNVRIEPLTATQVLVKVHAAGVNPVDYKRVSFPAFTTLASNSATGESGEEEDNDEKDSFLYDAKSDKQSDKHVSRLPGFPFPYVAGVDGAGEVVATGEHVTLFHIGDRVVFHSDLTQSFGGSFCEFAVVEQDVLVHIPLRKVNLHQQQPLENKNETKTQEKITLEQVNRKRLISYEEAAAIPCAGWTAYLALFDKLRVEAGRSIFIHGASGGVGSFAVQLAHHFGLFVIASCSPENASYVQSLGANAVIDYHHSPYVINETVMQLTQNGGGVGGVDYLLDLANDNLSEMRLPSLRFGGAICLVNGLLVPTTGALFARQLSVHYVFMGAMHGQSYTRPLLRELGERMMELYAEGVFHVQIEVQPFEAAAQVLDRLSTHHGTRGKVVLQIVKHEQVVK